MDYEKKYKADLELAYDYYKANLRLNNADENLMLEDIFPELAESEDERIKQSIIADIKSRMNNCTHTLDDYYREQIAWLEKQGKKGGEE